jgi:two-component system, NarL family, response regulator NreC
MSIKVLLADDHQIVRDGLRALLGAQDDMEVIAEAREGRTAVRLAEELSPDVIVMDISMPDLNGIDATRQIRNQNPNAQIVGLSAHSDEKMATRMMDAGALGFVPKDAAFEELTTAIRTVVAQRSYISPSLRFQHPMESNANGAKPRIPRGLTPREREVLQLMAEGKATKEVARHLNVSVKTVETQRRHIMEKLNIYSVAELTKYAIREGLTTLEH